MATTSPKLTLPFNLGAGSLLGQGTQPEAWVLYATDDVSDPTPVWVDATPKVRSFSTSRGRESELSEFDAGTATLTLDNRTRTFDPNSNALIKPMNRWWIREQFTGETKDLFKGYAESYDNQWPSGGWSDAECVVSCADEFKVLALDALPVTNPPRDNYSDVVLFDEPAAYYRMGDDSATYAQHATLGSDLRNPTAVSSGGFPGAIVGDSDGYVRMNSSGPSYLQTGAIDEMGGDFTDVGGLSEFAIELWFETDTLSPAGGDRLIIGPQAGGAGAYQYMVDITAGVITVTARNSALTVFTVSSPAIVANTWYHIVGTVESGFLRLYLNGVSVGTPVAYTPPFFSPLDAGAGFYVGDSAGAMTNADYDEVAVYRHGLTAARVLAHYQAGALRGFAQQVSSERIGSVLDAVSSTAPRTIGTGVRSITRRRQTGQDPLSAIRDARSADNVDAVFFTKADGTLTYLAADHRSSSPYNTVQVTFDDDGTDIPYLDLTVDYSESFLFNDWNVTRDGGEVQHVSDATSIAKYFKRSQSLTGLPLISDANAATIAAALLAKYKDPMQRITSLSFNTIDASMSEAVFRRELCDKIRVFRTAPGGGSRIDQSLFIQKIEVSGANDGNPWTIRWGVSPI